MILFINKRYNNRNGAARSGIDVVNSLIKSNASLVLLYVNSGNNFQEISNHKNLSILRAPRFKERLNKFSISNIGYYIEGIFFDYYRINKIKSLNIKFIVANSLSAEYYAKRISKILNVKSCLIVRESTEFYTDLKKAADRINYFDHVVFVSSNVMKKWFFILPGLKKKSTYMPNTIQESSISSIVSRDKNYFKKKLHFSDKEFNIVIVGKLMDRKNQHLIVSNLDRFIKLNKKVKFHFIGKNTNSYGQKMKRLVSQSGNKKMVSFHGFKNNILEYIYAADCLLLTAIAEVSPRVIYESMALRTPVIASDIDGVPELIKDNKTGFLYENNCVNSLLLKMDQLFCSSRINHIVEDAHRYYYDNFSNKIHEQNYSKLLKLLEDL